VRCEKSATWQICPNCQWHAQPRPPPVLAINRMARTGISLHKSQFRHKKSMLRSVEFIHRRERVVVRKRCFIPADECSNPVGRNSLWLPASATKGASLVCHAVVQELDARADIEIVTGFVLPLADGFTGCCDRHVTTRRVGPWLCCNPFYHP